MVFFYTFVHEPDLPYGGFTGYIKLFNLGILLASLLYTVLHSRFHQYYNPSPVFVYSAKFDGVRLPVKALLVCQSCMVPEDFVTASSFVSW